MILNRLALLATIFCSPIWAGDILFGPHKMSPGSGTVTFSLPNPSARYTVVVQNGLKGGELRLDNLALTINGRAVHQLTAQRGFRVAIPLGFQVQRRNTLRYNATGADKSFATVTLLAEGDLGEAVMTAIQKGAEGKAARRAYAFSVPDPESDYSIRIVNGDPNELETGGRAASMILDGTVTLNGATLFTPTDFAAMQGNPLETVLSSAVDLQAENLLEVSFKDAPRLAKIEVIRGASISPFQVAAISGGDQIGPANTLTPQPLRVQLLDENLNPAPGQVVFFKVSLGSGFVAETEEAQGTRLLGVTTDGSGFAEVFWQLGLNAGRERVTAFVNGFEDSGVEFRGISTAASATLLKEAGGNLQMGIVGQDLLQPIAVRVLDNYGNPIADQEVQLSVTRGGGLVNGESTALVTSNGEGLAQATWTLGPEQGLLNNEIEAAITELTGSPVRFLADGHLPGQPERTSLTARIVNQSGAPLAGVAVSFVGGDQTAISDADGFFQLLGLPAGMGAVHVDPVAINTESTVYPDLTFETVPIVEGNDNTMPTDIFLTALDVETAVTVPPDKDVMVTNPNIVGLEMEVAAGNAEFGEDAPAIHITRVENNRIPMPLPGGFVSGLFVTIQPQGLVFDQPAPISFPNVDGLDPGEQATIFSFDHDVGEYISVGTATVTADGTSLVSDPGSGIRKAGWHGVARPVDCEGTTATYEVKNPDGEPVADANVTIQNQTVKTDADGKASIQVESCDDAQSEVAASIPPRPRENKKNSRRGSSKSDDPVYLHSGEFGFGLKYLEIAGRGMNYEFHLLYESGLNYNGPTGFNWMHNYDKRIFKDADGNVNRIDGAGRQDLYVLDDTLPNGFRSPAGFYDVLFIDPITKDFCFRDRRGTLECYSPISGRLTEIRDRNQNRIRFRYDTRGRLTGVLDTYDREITYDYDSNGRLIRVADFIDRRVQLEYNSAGDLIKVTGPAVTGTPNGNDFPLGKSHLFTYSAGFKDENRNHNMLTVTRPNEAALSPVGPASTIMTYDDQDRVVRQDWGGTNATGVPAGGTVTFNYIDLGVTAEPGDLATAVSKTEMVDRNGNLKVYFHNQVGNEVRLEEHTNRNIIADDPDVFISSKVYNADGELIREVHPEGNATEYVYDDGSQLPFMRGNLLEIRRLKDADRGGSHDSIVTRFVYEPVYNSRFKVIQPRGNDPEFLPQNGGQQSAQRYTITRILDYQEGDNLSKLAELSFTSEDTLAAIFESIGLELNLGDLNGDGLTDQVAGNVIEQREPTVNLAPGSEMAAIEGDTTQEIVTTTTFNQCGQAEKLVDPEGNVRIVTFYPTNDPDGDGETTAGVEDTTLFGYPKRIIEDAETHPRRRVEAPPTQVTTDYFYDVVGNQVGVLDPRGVLTRRVVNQLDQLIMHERAAAVTGVPGRAGGENGETENLNGQDFAYKVLYEFDHNDNVTKLLVENRDGNTLESGQSKGFIETTSTFDILDDQLTSTEEIGVGQSRTWTYRYDANQNQILVQMPEGNRSTTGYDERDLEAVNVLGDNNNDPFDTPPANAAVTTYLHDGNRNLLRLTDSEDNNGDGLPESNVSIYDGFDRLIQERDALGNQALYTYDPFGNILSIEHRGLPGGVSPTTDSTAQNVLLSKTFYRYDERSRLIREDQALFATPGVDYLRDPILQDGELTPNDNLVSTVFEYDRNSRTRFRLEDDLDLHEKRFDGMDRVVEVIDAETNTARYSYDDNSNLIRQVTVERSPEGHVSEETFVNVSRYDSLNRPTRVVDSLGQTQRYTYDSRDLLIATTDAKAALGDDTETTTAEVILNNPGNEMRIFYDGLKRPIRTEYDLHQDGMGDLPIDTGQGGGDGVIRSQKTWDANDRLTAETDDNGNTTLYVYDELNRLIETRLADGTNNVLVYDRDHNITRMTDANGSIRDYTYDGINRLVRADITRGPGIVGTTVQTYEYDGLRRSTRCFDNNDPGNAGDDSTLQRRYDSLSRLLEEQQNEVAVFSDFAADNLRTGLVYPNGRQLDYTYDGLDRLKMISDNTASIEAGLIPAMPDGFIAQYDYIGAGRVLELRLGNGTRKTHLDDTGGVDQGYDGNARLVRQRHLGPSAQILVDTEFTYNRNNMRLSEKRLHAPVNRGGDRAVLDSLDRLVQFKRDLPLADVDDPDAGSAAEQRDYSLDGVGNWSQLAITAAGGPTETLTQTINEMNEYETFGETARTHDDNGNLTDDDTRLYAYDYLNRLVTVRRKSDEAMISHYDYDCLSRRTRRQVFDSADLNTSVHYFYDGYRIIEEQDDQGRTLTQYVDGAGLDEHLNYSRNNDPDANNGTEQVLFHHEDGKGWCAALTDLSGAVIERYSYDAYGRTRFENPDFSQAADQRQSAVGNPYSWQGQRLDPETGLFNNRFRYYDPETGRFLQRDPMGLWYDVSALGNAYLYGALNPWDYTDPFGMEGLLRNAASFSKGFLKGMGKEAADMAAGFLQMLKLLNPYNWDDFIGAVKDFIGKLLSANSGKDLIKELFPNLYKIMYQSHKLTTEQLGEAYGRALVQLLLSNAKMVKKMGQMMKKAKNKVLGKRKSPKGDKRKRCFAAGTLVLTMRGHIPIEAVRVGDLVWSRDPDSGTENWKEVTNAFNSQAPEIWDLTLQDQDGESIHLVVTPQHPFWHDSDRWLGPEQLVPGDYVWTRDGWFMVIQTKPRPGPITVYNFTVADYHTYFVGEADVWVHNDDCDKTKEKMNPADLPDDVKDLALLNMKDNGVAALGPYKPDAKSHYIDYAKSKKASYFDVGDKWNKLKANGQEWAANQHFLDTVASKGDKVLVSISKKDIKPGSYLAGEVKYLVEKKNYKWANGNTLVPSQ